MSDDVYYRLREFLDGLPGGFPSTESGVEIKLLKRYFTPEEAELTMQLTPMPETVSTIAGRTGVDEAEAAEKLESIAKQGSINRVRINGEPYYMAQQFLIGIYEFHLKAMDRELAELLGRPCEHPMESCLTFSFGAQYYIENGIGRQITVDECLRILDEAEKHAMVLSPTNSQAIMNICTCCGDSCNMLRGLKTYERPADHALSSFQAAIDPELCCACGTCLERCQIEAVVEGDDYMAIDLARYIGCGLCVPTCPENAASLAAKSDALEPPSNFIEMQMKMAAERGLLE